MHRVVSVPELCFVLNCVPQERSTQRNGAGFSGAAPRWVMAFLELTSAWVGHLGGLCWPWGMVEHCSMAREQISYFTIEKD